MREVKPRVYMIADTSLNATALRDYLDEIGADEYDISEQEILSDGEELIRTGGKLCYRSWRPGLNPNVKKVREDPVEYIRDSILKAAHGSVLEHATVSFIFHNVSRVFTHELVRHRAGTAMSQESLRYVRLTDLGFWMPSILQERDTDGRGQALIRKTILHLESVQKELAELYGIEQLGDFSIKKKLTSAFRRVAPIGLATGILWTMNLRAARHIVQMRTDPSAEEEIRMVFGEVGRQLKLEHPALFQDFDYKLVDGHPCWTCTNPANPYDKKN